jgi:hypothetical protein
VLNEFRDSSGSDCDGSLPPPLEALARLKSLFRQHLPAILTVGFHQFLESALSFPANRGQLIAERFERFNGNRPSLSLMG